METIALSVYGNRISSRLDVSEKVMIVTAEKNKIRTRDTILLESTDILKKLDAVIKLKPDVLICGGLTKLCSKKLKNYNIKVIPWVQGDIDNILKLYFEGLLTKNNNSVYK